MTTTEQDQSSAIARVLQENAICAVTSEDIVDAMVVLDSIGSTFRVEVPQWDDASAGPPIDPQVYEVTVRRIS